MGYTTQFAIRDPQVAVQPVLRLASAVATEFERNSGARLLRIAGICG